MSENWIQGVEQRPLWYVQVSDTPVVLAMSLLPLCKCHAICARAHTATLIGAQPVPWAVERPHPQPAKPPCQGHRKTASLRNRRKGCRALGLLLVCQLGGVTPISFPNPMAVLECRCSRATKGTPRINIVKKGISFIRDHTGPADQRRDPAALSWSGTIP